MEFTVKPVENPDELKQAAELLARGDAWDYPAARRWLETCGLRYPGFQREHMRIAMRGPELAGALLLHTDTLRLGDARLRAGRPGKPVVTERMRGRGVASLLLADAFAYMKHHGFHVALLFEPEDVHARYGCAPVFPDYRVTLDVREALTFTSPLRVRALKPGDIAALQRLHGTNDLRSACSVVRTRAHYMCRWGGFQGGQAVIDEDGKVEAYLVSRVSRGALEVAEAAVASPGLTPAVLAAAGRAAEARGLPRVEFSTPPGHPVARYLRQFASRHEARVDPRRNAALAIVDARETFEIMIPDWEARLAHTALGLGRCEVTLQVGPSSYRVRAHHGAVDISEVSGAAKLALDPAQFAQALAGYRPIADIAGPAFNALPEEAQDLLETLFVERFPHVWVLDASGPEAAGMGEDTGRDGD